MRRDATELLEVGLKAVGLSQDELPALPRSDDRKAFIADQIATKTSTSRIWIAEVLHMGKPTTVTRLVKKYRDDPKVCQRLSKSNEQRMSRFAT